MIISERAGEEIWQRRRQGGFANNITVSTLVLIALMAADVCRAAEPLAVIGVIDGETLQLADGEKVRLTGIDVPASSKNVKLRDDIKNTGKDAATLMAAGKNAAKFLRKLLKNEKIVLEYDATKADSSGRRRAYAYLYLDPKRNMEIPADWYAELSPGTGERQLRVFLNATMIRAGYAQVVTDAFTSGGQSLPTNVRHKELFFKLQKEAQEQKRGLWG